MSENDYFGPLTIAGRIVRPMARDGAVYWFVAEEGGGVQITFNVRRGAVPPDDELWFGKIRLHGIDCNTAAIADVFGHDPHDVAEKLNAAWDASLAKMMGVR